MRERERKKLGLKMWLLPRQSRAPRCLVAPITFTNTAITMTQLGEMNKCQKRNPFPGRLVYISKDYPCNPSFPLKLAPVSRTVGEGTYEANIYQVSLLVLLVLGLSNWPHQKPLI